MGPLSVKTSNMRSKNKKKKKKNKKKKKQKKQKKKKSCEDMHESTRCKGS